MRRLKRVTRWVYRDLGCQMLLGGIALLAGVSLLAGFIEARMPKDFPETSMWEVAADWMPALAALFMGTVVSVSLISCGLVIASVSAGNAVAQRLAARG